MIDVDSALLRGYKYIDLFCGIGGFRLALSSFGAECVFSSDIDRFACNTYEKNFHVKPDGDIEKIFTTKIPEHDILCAGFPCQPFSISGNKQGFDDKKGRGELFLNIIRIARAKKPKIIILENVKNLLFHNSGKTYASIKSELEGLNYRVFESVLCASDFGVPQARERLYIVAVKKKYRLCRFDFPQPLNSFHVLSDILLDENEIGENFHITRDYVLFDNLFDDINYKQLKRIGNIGDGRQGERIYSIHGQATTLSSQGGGLGGKTGIYLVNNVIRILTPRECARLMGFPDDYQLADTVPQCYKQFGNSVVVDVIQYIVQALINQIGEL